MQTNEKPQKNSENKIEVINRRALLTQNILIKRNQKEDELIEVNEDKTEYKKKIIQLKEFRTFNSKDEFDMHINEYHYEWCDADNSNDFSVYEVKKESVN